MKASPSSSPVKNDVISPLRHSPPQVDQSYAEYRVVPAVMEPMMRQHCKQLKLVLQWEKQEPMWQEKPVP